MDDKALERLFEDVMYDPKWNNRDREDMKDELKQLDPRLGDFVSMIKRFERTFGNG